MSRNLTREEVDAIVTAYSEKVRRHRGMQVLLTESGRLRIDIIVMEGASKPVMTGGKKDRFILYLQSKDWETSAYKFFDIEGHGRCFKVDLIAARAQFTHFIKKRGWG